MIRAEGRWQALRHDDVDVRSASSMSGIAPATSSSSFARASGLSIDEYGLELGEVSLDERLAGMLDGDARFKPLPTPPGMEFSLYTFQESGHGWLRLLGDLGIGWCSPTTWGSGRRCRRSR